MPRLNSQRFARKSAPADALGAGVVSEVRLPRIVIAGLAGGTGKTLVSMGLARVFRNAGFRAAVAKKGPDFIDAAWLGVAAGTESFSLDTFLMSDEAIYRSLYQMRNADIAIVEGSRGLFDGLDAQGSHSTAELARLIRAPLVLVVDASKATRTIAALVLGCQALEPDLPLVGVILNRVGTSRQQGVILEALARCTQTPVLGVIRRQNVNCLPSRHLGLIMPSERPDLESTLDEIGDIISRSVDVAAIRDLALRAPPLRANIPPCVSLAPHENHVQIGFLRDAAFSFYYPENLTALSTQGAALVAISPLDDAVLPAIDALYMGGGYPEEYAARLSANREFRSALATEIARGLPVWAECGGLMYLARELVCADTHHPMVGAIPLVVEQTSVPQAHGYVEACVDRVNPFLPVGMRLRGHEFHYSRVGAADASIETALALERGAGIGGGRDGIIAGNVFASYMHLFAPGVPGWARAFVDVARRHQAGRKRTLTSEGRTNGQHCSGKQDNRSGRRRVYSRAREMG